MKKQIRKPLSKTVRRASRTRTAALPPALAPSLEAAISGDHLANIWEGCKMPSRKGVARLLDDFLAVLFPGAFGDPLVQEKRLGAFLQRALRSLRDNLAGYATMALDFEARQSGADETVCGDNRSGGMAAAEALLKRLPDIRSLLSEDLRAAYEGDPAATSVVEVLLSYPFVPAIATHRIAHELYLLKIPLLPRMLNEVAHSRTGIDIHPGARIGAGLFIDHGTGVVIGETAVIGKGVKIYQGVTLGALSFPKDADGNPIKGVKRHPDIEDHVTLYAGATVLGGDTVIGRNSVIGGNCWITSSVPPDTLVLSERTRQQHRD